MPIITDKDKIVTDDVLINHLSSHSIDYRTVEFVRDYDANNPYSKHYWDSESKNEFMVFSGLPMVARDGIRISTTWHQYGNGFESSDNLFYATVHDEGVNIKALYDQSKDIITGSTIEWSPSIYISEKKIPLISINLLQIDPTNKNYSYNTIEWDYGICKRRLRLIEGRILERWIFENNPEGDILIKHNSAGTIPLHLGYCSDNNGNRIQIENTKDEEFVYYKELTNAIYPVEIGASVIFNPDANPESASVDGEVRYDSVANWSTVIGASTATSVADSATSIWIITIGDGSVDPKVEYFSRGIFLFNTASLTSSATITAATFSGYGLAPINDELASAGYVGLVSSNPASNTSLAVGDFDCLGSTDYITRQAVAGISSSGYNDWALNASGIAAISKTGVTKFGTRTGWDIDGGTHPWKQYSDCRGRFYSSEQGAGYKPKLTVTYTIWNNTFNGILSPDLCIGLDLPSTVIGI